MNKNELISAIAEKTDANKKTVESMVNAFADTVTEAIKNGDTVTLVGFGTFSLKQTAARVGRNPQTGAEMQIPAKRVPAFKPGKQFKERVS